jgi:hypothetical protein
VIDEPAGCSELNLALQFIPCTVDVVALIRLLTMCISYSLILVLLLLKDDDVRFRWWRLAIDNSNKTSRILVN